MCRPLQQPTASLRAVEWRVAPLDLRLWRRVGAGATRLPVRRRHRRQGKIPRDRDQAPHCTHAGRRAGAVPTAARTRRALRRPVRAETAGLPRRLEWRLGSRARDAAITPPLRPSPSGHGAMPIPPWCRGAHCERCPCCLRVSVLCVSGSLSCVLCISCVVVWRKGEPIWVSQQEILVEIRKRPLVPPSLTGWVQRHDRDWMPKTVCLLLACLVLAAGQAATRDTTQWRCRNRKLSCKRWAADNQCTANYPFMAEGVLHHHLRAHGTRHTAHAAARGARHVESRRIARSRAVDAPSAHPWTATCHPWRTTSLHRGVMHVPTR